MNEWSRRQILLIPGLPHITCCLEKERIGLGLGDVSETIEARPYEARRLVWTIFESGSG